MAEQSYAPGNGYAFPVDANIDYRKLYLYIPGAKPNIVRDYGAFFVVGAALGAAVFTPALAAGSATADTAAGVAESANALPVSGGIDLSADIPSATSFGGNTAPIAVETSAYDAAGISSAQYSATYGASSAFSNLATAVEAAPGVLAKAAAGIAVSTGLSKLMPKKNTDTAKKSSSASLVPVAYTEVNQGQSNSAAIVTAIISGLIVIILARVFL
jgi:hypothetical protein